MRRQSKDVSEFIENIKGSAKSFVLTEQVSLLTAYECPYNGIFMMISTVSVNCIKMVVTCQQLKQMLPLDQSI